MNNQAPQQTASALNLTCLCVCAGKTTKHQKKKSKTGKLNRNGAALFSGDGINPASAADGKEGVAGSSSGGGKAERLRSSQLSKTELNKVKRHGKGKSAFKSKKKYKRR